MHTPSALSLLLASVSLAAACDVADAEHLDEQSLALASPQDVRVQGEPDGLAADEADAGLDAEWPDAPPELTAPVRPQADASCTALVSGVVAQLQAHPNMSYRFEMTMHRTNENFVSYGVGSIGTSGYPSWPLNGVASHLFSARFNAGQPFDVYAADSISVWIDANGQLYIYDHTWSFSTQWDMSCVGNVITRVIPGHGVVSLSFRELFYPIS